MSQTKAQLQEELEAMREENERLKQASSAPVRIRFPGGLWANDRRRPGKRDPEWRNNGMRFVIPDDAKPGDAFWVEFSMWEYDPDTSPANYTKNPPDFTLSASPCLPHWAKQLEDNHQEFLQRRMSEQNQL